ncbi:MAG: ThiF family adenylyltransferase [Anaerolineae bacterium]|nr:ThiF family adenylyltransferase [Anaerolineae bacterium]
MHEAFHHEALYRGEEALEGLARVRLVVCGAGAVGSNLVDSLVRQGYRELAVIDFDRIEAHNVGTQTYAESDVGAFKVDILQAEVFRAVGVEIGAVRQRLTARNVGKLLRGADLVIDGFDNHESRAVVTEHCRAGGIPCLHVGLSADYAEVVWNESYRVPRDVEQPGGDVCDYPLARNLIQFAVALAAEAVIRFVLEGRQQGYSFTLQDLQVNREGDAAQA